ncbi:hypothetical protein EIM50_18160 [Pseudoxanthomonas sp. SGD-10]|nr:hypothetical protein EIM50_18160 [Pseudoxanthomonas sp. SGD-10]
MNFKYLISSELQYDKLICNDAGPQYAASMRWHWETIGPDTNLISNMTYIIDNRLSINECEIAGRLITQYENKPFLIKVVDPYFENINHQFYIWMSKMLEKKNVFLLSVYEPKEIIRFLRNLHPNKLIYIPYPYDPGKELNLDNLKGRKNKVIISGSINKDVYPLRTAIWKNSRRSISRFFFQVLKHPGYPDIHKREFEHNLIGNSYIAFLSNFKAMFLCGTRVKIELLKYHECAYAGCLPIGEAPDCFPTEIQNIFQPVNVRFPFLQTLIFFLRWNSTSHRRIVTQYRSYLRRHRNPEYLNNLLKEKLNLETSFYTS